MNLRYRRYEALSLLRLIGINGLPWFLLSGIYSAILIVLLDPVVENLNDALGVNRLSPWIVWACLAWMMALAALLNVWKAGLPIRISATGRLPPVSRALCAQEIRQWGYWIAALGAIGLGLWFGQVHWALALWGPQLCVQRVLFSMVGWQRLISGIRVRSGPEELLLGLAISQSVAWVPFGIWMISTRGWEGALASLAGIVAGTACAFEGDSGRPWLVNWICFSSASLGILACLASPWFFLVVVYFFSRMLVASRNRSLSVENLYEDCFI